MLKKAYYTLILTILFCVMLCVSVNAEEEDRLLPNEYYSVLEELPDDVADRLPNEIYSENDEELANGLEKMVSAEYFFDIVGDILGMELKEAVALLGKICGLLLLSAVFNVIKNSIGSEALASAFGFCSTCAIFSAIVGVIHSQINMVADFFERLNSMMLGFVPISCAVWAMGGNVGTAAASGSALYAFLAISESLCAKAVVPISSLCIAFALCRGIAPSLNLSGFSSALKKCYTFSLGFIMTLLLAILSSQTVLSASADSVGARSAKMITASLIPIVGGGVSDTLRTLGSSVQYIKSVVGVSAVIFIIILLLPTLISLIVTRFVFLISGSVADLLGCDRESRLIGEIGGVSGCMIAAVSMCSVMFVFAFNIFIKSTVAVG